MDYVPTVSLSPNVFSNDAFSTASLTSWVNENVPFVPGLIGSLPSMFLGQGVYSPDVMFDEVNGTLSLIQSSPRGAPPQQSVNEKGKMRSLSTVRLALEATIKADELAKVRVPGTSDQVNSALRLVQRRIEGPTGIKASHALTKEHMYVGAINGQVYDADGTTLLWDYFNAYGVGRPAAVNVAFGGLTADGGDFAKALEGAKRTMTKALNGLSLATAMPVCLCGDNYYDAARYNKEAVAARKTGALGKGADEATRQITSSKAYGSFVYGDIIFINYRGSDDGKVSIPTDEGRLFMTGVPGLFNEYFAPADTMEWVNTEGLPSYVLRREERQTSSQWAWEVQSNPLPICMRPLHLLQMTKS